MSEMTNRLEESLETFIRCPPNGDFEKGFLAALIVVAREIIPGGHSSDRLCKVEAMLDASKVETAYKRRPTLRLVTD